MKFYFTKTFLPTIWLGVMSSGQVHANQWSLSCKGTIGSNTYLFEVYEGGFNEDKLSLKEITADKQVISSIMLPARGGSFVGCGTRTVPCDMIQSIQYSSNSPYIIFSMTGPLDSKVGHGSIDIHENGFNSETELIKTIELDCIKNQ